MTIARARPPYWAGALTPSGNAALTFFAQHGQVPVSARCSVTSMVICSGRSKTWRTSWPSAPVPRPRPRPRRLPSQCAQRTPSLWVITWSGSATRSSVFPLCPFCPPGLRLPCPPRPFFGGLLGLPRSDDGGLLLLRLLLSSDAIFASSCSIRTTRPSKSDAGTVTEAPASASSSSCFRSRSSGPTQHLEHYTRCSTSRNFDFLHLNGYL